MTQKVFMTYNESSKCHQTKSQNIPPPKNKHPELTSRSSKHLLGEPGTGRLFQASGLWKPVKDRRIDRRPMADRAGPPKSGGSTLNESYYNVIDTHGNMYMKWPHGSRNACSKKLKMLEIKKIHVDEKVCFWFERSFSFNFTAATFFGWRVGPSLQLHLPWSELKWFFRKKNRSFQAILKSLNLSRVFVEAIWSDVVISQNFPSANGFFQSALKLDTAAKWIWNNWLTLPREWRKFHPHQQPSIAIHSLKSLEGLAKKSWRDICSWKHLQWSTPEGPERDQHHWDQNRWSRSRG